MRSHSSIHSQYTSTGLDKSVGRLIEVACEMRCLLVRVQTAMLDEQRGDFSAWGRERKSRTIDGADEVGAADPADQLPRALLLPSDDGGGAVGW